MATIKERMEALLEESGDLYKNFNLKKDGQMKGSTEKRLDKLADSLELSLFIDFDQDELEIMITPEGYDDENLAVYKGTGPTLPLIKSGYGDPAKGALPFVKNVKDIEKAMKLLAKFHDY